MVDVIVNINTTSIDLVVTEEKKIIDVVVEKANIPVDVLVTPTVVAVLDPNMSIDGGTIT